MRIGEFAFAAAQPGEIETQHADAVHGQPLGDALGRQDVLAAGEAMREQREGGGLPSGKSSVAASCSPLALGNLKRLLRMMAFPGRLARMDDILEGSEVFQAGSGGSHCGCGV